MFELPHSIIDETKKEVVSLALETPCGFQCQRSSKRLTVIPGHGNVGFKLKPLVKQNILKIPATLKLQWGIFYVDMDAHTLSPGLI